MPTPREPKNLSKARTEFITASQRPLLTDLAKKYGINLSTLYTRSSREHWQHKREEYQQRLASETLEVALTRAAKDRAKLLDATSALSLHTAKSLADKANSNELQTSVHSLDTLARLNLLLGGGADARVEVTGDVGHIVGRIVAEVVTIISEEVPDLHVGSASGSGSALSST